MLQIEYRIPLPITVEQYQIGQLFTVAEVSKQETGGSNGIKVIVNEPFDELNHAPPTPLLNGEFTKGQYTEKEYYLQKKVPSYVASLFKASYFTVVEKAWNAYPYCRTVITNLGLSEETFKIVIESYHKSELDIENSHKIDEAKYKSIQKTNIDIGDKEFAEYYKCYNSSYDPSLFKSKNGLGPLKKDWFKDYSGDIMCAYKLVSITASAPFLTSIIQNYIADAECKLFLDFHRKVFCYIDQWIDMDMPAIRAYEEKTKRDLEEQFETSELRGQKTE